MQIAQFVRGLAIQVALRYVTDEVLVEPKRATLIYSRLDGPRAGLLRSAVSVAAATCVGVSLFLVSNLLLMVPVGLLLRLAGVSTGSIAAVALSIAAVRLTWTAARAVTTYRLERRRQRSLAPVGDQPRWRLDYMGAVPPRRGHGAALLREFVARSDAAGATVYLATEPHNRAFYRRGGFHVVPASGPDFEGMLLMRRIAPTAKIPQQRLSRAAQPASR